MNSDFPQYRQLGGWLMFLNIVLILGAVSYGMSIPSSFGFLIASAVDIPELAPFAPLFGTLFWATLLFSAAMFLGCLYGAIFLNKRRRRAFYVCFFGVLGLHAAVFAAGTVFFATGAATGFVRDLFNRILQVTDSPAMDAAELRSLEAVLQVDVAGACGIALAIALALIVGWGVYFGRSRRAAVYFDPDAGAYVQAPVYAGPGGYALGPGGQPPMGYGPYVPAPDPAPVSPHGAPKSAPYAAPAPPEAGPAQQPPAGSGQPPAGSGQPPQ